MRELDAAQLELLRAPQLARALADCGIELPQPAHAATWLEDRAADYHDLFLRPEMGPLVQSLWMQGRYEGDATVRVRQLAQLAAVEFQPEAARGAAPDHLGSLLLLWAATDERAPSVAAEIVSAHLSWAQRPLHRIAAAGGFYGALATVTTQLLDALSRQAA